MAGRALLWGSLGVGVLLGAACGSSEGATVDDPPPDAPGVDGGDEAVLGLDAGEDAVLGLDAGEDAVLGLDAGDAGVRIDDSGNVDEFGDVVVPPDALTTCATSTQEAKQLPLDVYLMVDTSGSMLETVSAGGTKWDAVKQAITSFVNDPGSAGIGVGMAYFPIPNPNVPAFCTSNAACGAGGPCFLHMCQLPGPGGTAVHCTSNADCPGTGNACMPLGLCQNNNQIYCPYSPGSSCGSGLGKCSQVVTSYCENPDNCTASAYAAPVVSIAPLPGSSSAITTSLGQQNPTGQTPTSAALQGAVDEAKSFAAANAGHTVVTVLATDGLPNECDTSIADIAQIASGGISGTPAVKTFVIGVFAPAEAATAQSNLDQIAAAGGTTSSFIVNTGQDVEQQFLAALDQIRYVALPCEYTLPIPDSGTPDYSKVNVEFTEGNGTSVVLPYVGNASNCGSTGGWYYDADPQNGGTPTKAEICPTTCATIKNDVRGRVDVIEGCTTVIK